MKLLKRLLLLTGLLASSVALLMVTAGLFIFALQSPVEIRTTDGLSRVQVTLNAK